jgi:hypothetical protein
MRLHKFVSVQMSKFYHRRGTKGSKPPSNKRSEIRQLLCADPQVGNLASLHLARHTTLWYNITMPSLTFIELPPFTKDVYKYLTEASDGFLEQVIVVSCGGQQRDTVSAAGRESFTIIEVHAARYGY